MEKFIRFPSLNNVEQQKSIDYFVRNKPDVLTARYLITEKIDGANFQIIITKDNVEYASRNEIIPDDNDFYEYKRVMEGWKEDIEKIQDFIKQSELPTKDENGNVVDTEVVTQINLYGELYGKGIMKRINYGNDKYFRIFHMAINGEMMPQPTTIGFLWQMGINVATRFVPILGWAIGLEEALSKPHEFNSMLTPPEMAEGITDGEIINVCEGIVIIPADEVVIFDEKTFILKKKNDKFREKDKSRLKKQIKVISPELASAQNLFLQYINENRLQSVYSKLGIIADVKDIGKYIKATIEDAREDFLKDNKQVLVELEDKDKRKVFGCATKLVRDMILKDL